jgi:prevent-host-death family protein
MRLKPNKLLKESQEQPIYVFYRSKPKAVLLSLEKYQKLTQVGEDYLLSLKAREYEKEDKKAVKWQTLDEVLAKTDKQSV